METAPYFVRSNTGSFEGDFSTEKTEEIIDEPEDPSGFESLTKEQLDDTTDQLIESLGEAEVLETAHEAEATQDEASLPRNLGTEALVWFEPELNNEEELHFEQKIFSPSSEEVVLAFTQEETAPFQPAYESVAMNEAVVINEEPQNQVEIKNEPHLVPQITEARLVEEAITAIEQQPQEEVKKPTESRVGQEPKQQASPPKSEPEPNSPALKYRPERAVSRTQAQVSQEMTTTRLDRQSEAEVLRNDSQADTEAIPDAVRSTVLSMKPINQIPEREALTESSGTTTVESVEEIVTYVEHRIEQIVTQKKVYEAPPKIEHPAVSSRPGRSIMAVPNPHPAVVYQAAATKTGGSGADLASATTALPETDSYIEEADSVTKIVQDLIQKLDWSSMTEPDTYHTLRRLRQRIAALQDLAEVLRQQLGRQAIRLSKVSERSFA